MKLSELIEQLQEHLEELDGQDPDVLIIHQRNWPLQETIGGIYNPNHELWECENCGCEDCDYNADCPECGEPHHDPDEDTPLYLVANGHPHDMSPYGPKSAWDAV